MARYQYRATDQTGKAMTGQVSAGGLGQAHQFLESKGWRVAELRELEDNIAPTKPTTPGPPKHATAPVAPSNPVRTTSRKPLQSPSRTPSTAPPQAPQPFAGDAGSSLKRSRKSPSEKQAYFVFSQLSTMLRAGIGPHEALQSIGTRLPESPMRAALLEASTDTGKGKPMSETFERHPELFPDYAVALVRAGEFGGFLPEACASAEKIAEEGYGFKRSFWWFVFILGQAALALPVGIVFARSLPEAYKRVEQGSSAGNAMVEAFVDTFKWPYGPIFLVIAIALFFGIRWWLSPGATYRRHQLAMTYPLFRERVRGESIAIFTWVLGRLGRGGVSPWQSWKLAVECVPNRVMRQRLIKAGEGMREGSKLSDTMFASGLFPEDYSPMVATGETVGDVPGAMEHLANASRGEFESAQRRLKARSAGWGCLLTAILGGILLIVVAKAWYVDLVHAVVGDL